MESSTQIAARLTPSSTAVFVIGDQSVILFGNVAAGALLGCEPADVVGHALDIPHSVDHESEVEMICAGGEVQRIRIVSRHVDWDGMAAFEVELHVVAVAAPLPEPEPEPVLEPEPAPAPEPIPEPAPLPEPEPLPEPPAPPPPPPAPIPAPAPVPVPAPAPVPEPIPIPAPVPPPEPEPTPLPAPAPAPAPKFTGALPPRPAPLTGPPPSLASVTAPKPDPTPAPAAAAPTPAGPPAAPVKRILILEDDLSIGDIQCRMLKTLGYATVWTKLGEDTIEKCKEAVEKDEKFVVALLDLTIHGGMGGREAVRHLMKLDPDLKAIACSGYSDDALNKELLKEGFIDILPKPFRAQELGKILKKNLG